MKYDIHGPFEVTRIGRLVDKGAKIKREFWNEVDFNVDGLSNAVGCYVFCIGKKPWYVGMAEKQSFRKECSQPHKINAFNSALGKHKGKPYLVLISKLTNEGRFVKPGINGHKSTRFLEDLLIGMAFSQNPNLENIRGTKFIKELVVPGILNTPKGKLFPVSEFVHCVPTESIHHPHQDVKNDLIGHTVHTSDYENSIILNYHF